MSSLRLLTAVGALACAAVVAIHAQSSAEPRAELRRAAALFEAGKYSEALGSFAVAATAPDAAIAIAAHKGVVRAALRVGEFARARRAAEILSRDAPADADTWTLSGDAMWAAGYFDEADAAYARARTIEPDSSRAALGLARSLGSRSHLSEALDSARLAVERAPRDPDAQAVLGTVLERLNRFDEAAAVYSAYAELLPSRESIAIGTARSRASLLRSFAGRQPLDVRPDDAAGVHVVPFKLVNNKIVALGRLNGVRVEWVVDTGAERTGISPDVAFSARVQTLSSTLTAGVGRLAFRRIGLGRADVVEVGSLAIRNVPVSIRSPGVGGAARWQGQSLSPISLGFSLSVDYRNKRLTLARQLPETPAETTLPLRVERLPLIRGTLNSTQPAYFVVDTGGEVISIGADTAALLGVKPPRHIPLKVLGMSGADEEAFLLPGVDVDFDNVSLGRIGLAVLNLRAPSVLLGFQVGGIVGHQFLGRYVVSIDVARSEVRLARSGQWAVGGRQ